MDASEAGKRQAAEAAASLVEDGMVLGLGTGSTVAYFLPAVATRGPRVRCVATSLGTERAARTLGLVVEPFESLDRLDLAVDSADQVAPDRWLVKGGGGAHTREKIVAAAASRFLVIVSSEKVVPALRPPVPLELMRFGLAATLRRIWERGPVRLREAEPTPDVNLQADLAGEVGDPAELAAALDAIPGVVGHGLFDPSLVSDVLVGGEPGGVRRLPDPR
ncbi:MAG: ribose 5-phosphate isomerase A [Actinobacteria bacterium]|nr:MAG: ribose 5-phosphate isomerase A [Actinomycetota bacterium]